MTFDEVLPLLIEGSKFVRQGWGGAENYIKYVAAHEMDGELLTPYFVIHVSGEGYSMFQPTVCDLLATDWKIVS